MFVPFDNKIKKCLIDSDAKFQTKGSVTFPLIDDSSITIISECIGIDENIRVVDKNLWERFVSCKLGCDFLLLQSTRKSNQTGSFYEVTRKWFPSDPLRICARKFTPPKYEGLNDEVDALRNHSRYGDGKRLNERLELFGKLRSGSEQPVCYLVSLKQELQVVQPILCSNLLWFKGVLLLLLKLFTHTSLLRNSVLISFFLLFPTSPLIYYKDALMYTLTFGLMANLVWKIP